MVIPRFKTPPSRPKFLHCVYLLACASVLLFKIQDLRAMRTPHYACLLTRSLGDALQVNAFSDARTASHFMRTPAPNHREYIDGQGESTTLKQGLPVSASLQATASSSLPPRSTPGQCCTSSRALKHSGQYDVDNVLSGPQRCTSFRVRLGHWASDRFQFCSRSLLL